MIPAVACKASSVRADGVVECRVEKAAFNEQTGEVALCFRSSFISLLSTDSDYIFCAIT